MRFHHGALGFSTQSDWADVCVPWKSLRMTAPDNEKGAAQGAAPFGNMW